MFSFALLKLQSSPSAQKVHTHTRRGTSTYARSLYTLTEGDSLWSGQRSTSINFQGCFPPQNILLFLNAEVKAAAFTVDINNEHGSCCNNALNTFFLSGPIERKVQVGYINLLYCVLQVFKSFKSLQLFWHSTASHNLSLSQETSQHKAAYQKLLSVMLIVAIYPGCCAVHFNCAPL